MKQEIQTLKLLKNKITELGKPKEFVDARKLLNRENRQIRYTNPFVEMKQVRTAHSLFILGKG